MQFLQQSKYLARDFQSYNKVILNLNRIVTMIFSKDLVELKNSNLMVIFFGIKYTVASNFFIDFI